MITQQDQLDLFRIIASKLDRDVTCYAFGGTAMMFYGYKDETKDIDLLFEKEDQHKAFIQAIEEIGFTETSPVTIYIKEKLKDKSKPIMFSYDDYRIDVFLKRIFRTKLSPSMIENTYAIHEFREKHILTVKVLRKENIVQLKAITERVNDFNDIQTILKKDKHFDWQYVIDEAIWQHKNGDSWMLLDMEKMMKELKEYIPLQEKYFKQLYAAQ